MLDKIVSSQEKAPDGTGYNDPPIGLGRISEKEFATSEFFSYRPVASEYRQIYVTSKDDLTPNRNGKMMSIQMYWYHDGTGIAMHADYWGGKVEYFAFGCKHKYHERSRAECESRGILHFGNCYHVEECSECKYVNSYDSSD